MEQVNEDADKPQKRAREKPKFKIFEPSTGRFKLATKDTSNSDTSFTFINTDNDSIAPHARRAARSHITRRVRGNLHRRSVTESGDEIELKAASSGSHDVELGNTAVSDQRGRAISSQISASNATQSLVIHGANRKIGLLDVFNRDLANVRTSSSEAEGGVAASILPQLVPAFGGDFPVTSHSLQLLQFSIQVVLKSSTPMSKADESDWFIQATHNAALFRGTLLLATAHQALLRNIPLPLECYQHQNELIRNINLNLDVPEKQLGQHTVAAVLCLAAVENITSPSTGRSIHMQGLRQIMNIRSERSVPHMPFYIYGFLHWVDLSHASANFLPSLCDGYGLLPPDATLQQEKDFHASLDLQWKIDSYKQPAVDYPGMDTLMNALFHRLKQLSTLASFLHNSTTNSLLHQQLLEHTLLLERQVNASTWSPKICHLRITDNDVVRVTTKTWHCVVLTYIHVILRKAILTSRVVQKLVARTKEALFGLEERELWSLFPKELLLWTLLVAGSASTVVDDATWFLRMLVRWKVEVGMNGRGWEDVKSVIEGHAWAMHLCEGPWRRFWDAAGEVEVFG